MDSKATSIKSKGSLSSSGKKKQSPVQRTVSTQHDIPAICRALQAAKKPAVLAMQETKDGFVRVGTDTSQMVVLKNLLRDLFAPRGGRAGFQYRGKICQSVGLVANSGLGKYLQFLGGASVLNWNSVATAAEFTILDALFDEFFIHSISLKYIPQNRYSSNSSASTTSSGSPGDVNTCGATVVCLYHNASPYADAAAAWANMAVARSHKVVDLAAPWLFRAANIERFDPAGPLGDMTTATCTMSWCLISSAAKYGGFFQVATPTPTANAASTSAILASGVFGNMMVSYDISWRARA